MLKCYKYMQISIHLIVDQLEVRGVDDFKVEERLLSATLFDLSHFSFLWDQWHSAIN